MTSTSTHVHDPYLRHLDLHARARPVLGTPRPPRTCSSSDYGGGSQYGRGPTDYVHSQVSLAHTQAAARSR